MRDIVILLLFLGISSFIKKMMKGAKTRGQQPPGKPAPPPGTDRREKIVDALGELLGVEEPDDFAFPAPDNPEASATAPEPAYAETPEPVYTAPLPASPMPVRPTEAKLRPRRKRGTLRRGIILREVLGPCRAMQPYGTD